MDESNIEMVTVCFFLRESLILIILNNRLMHGERPYWWVHEMEEAHKADVHPHKISEIHQYSSTCETGPGMPSGHSMAMSAAWYVIIHAVVEHVVDPSNMR